MGDHSFIIEEVEGNGDSDSEENVESRTRMDPMLKHYESSEYTSSSDGESSRSESPVAEDGKIFLSEVIDSLARGYEEKANPDFLILEINSSRYAYNMSLDEVNYYVVKAILSLPLIVQENSNVSAAFNSLLGHLGPVMKNYIRGESAMQDCLKAFEDVCHENEAIKSKVAQLIHYLYDKEYVTEEAILVWYEELEKEETMWMHKALAKLVTWLQQSSEEESDGDED